MSTALKRWLRFGKTKNTGRARDSTARVRAKTNGRNASTGAIKKAASSWRLAWSHRLKSLGGIVLCASIGCGVLLALGVGSMWLHRFVTTSPFFAIKQVDVVGNTRISREMVLDYAGLHVGDNSLAVSLAKVEHTLLETPWVQEVSVKRLLPDRFVIRVQERLPSFWVRKDGALFYADARGVIIAPVETHNFLALPTLMVASGAEDALDRIEEYLAILRSGLRSGRLPVEFGTVSTVSLTPAKGMELYLEDRELRFSIATDDFKGNLERLGITLMDLTRRNALGTVREIRATDGNVWVINNG